MNTTADTTTINTHEDTSLYEATVTISIPVTVEGRNHREASENLDRMLDRKELMYRIENGMYEIEYVTYERLD